MKLPSFSELEKLHAEVSVVQIAARFGVSRRAVYKALQRRNGKYTRAKALREECGLTRQDVCRAVQLASIPEFWMNEIHTLLLGNPRCRLMPRSILRVWKQRVIPYLSLTEEQRRRFLESAGVTV